MVSSKTPAGKVTKSELELVGRMLHHTCMSQCYDIRKRNTLALKDNTDGLYWQKNDMPHPHSHQTTYSSCRPFTSGFTATNPTITF